MVKTGLEIIAGKLPSGLKGKRIGVLCHAPSVTRDLTHITEIIRAADECSLAAIFGPQHGLFGETQDNMIEWEGAFHPIHRIPVFSLYGRNRKPTQDMLKHIDILLVDLQDVGARLYTYIWTLKECIDACAEAGLPVIVLDRPNPVAGLPFDGPVLKEEYFTFVGGASIPMCHRMTIGEMALWIREKYFPRCELHIVWMQGWRRDLLFSETGLPWIIPSPNMPTLQTAVVYPGTVLFEALSLSEGRGTTLPFELFGAPWIDSIKLLKNLRHRNLRGCLFREHSFIPTFNKFCGQLCNGIQIHVTDPRVYHPVETALMIIDAIMEISQGGYPEFRLPPYEYEEKLMPFDILSGDAGMRMALINRMDMNIEIERWNQEIAAFKEEFREISFYE